VQWCFPYRFTFTVGCANTTGPTLRRSLRSLNKCINYNIRHDVKNYNKCTKSTGCWSFIYNVSKQKKCSDAVFWEITTSDPKITRKLQVYIKITSSLQHASG
jgi:hypothetical protein